MACDVDSEYAGCEVACFIGKQAKVGYALLRRIFVAFATGAAQPHAESVNLVTCGSPVRSRKSKFGRNPLSHPFASGLVFKNQLKSELLTLVLQYLSSDLSSPGTCLA